ncbi:hypothetical protein FSP39_009302 [Pinctada imbricata]|uniref:DUF6589 domain-containing protein n=1 Tax=Pinctada imbricata TaxID=66713 RepID=A0AA88YLT8_PINIB|nr:hypothetical protein FSP39_009302 [Pinctada imbricata]
MIYSVVMSSRFEELSRFQKVITSVLMEEHVHQKVFDRLNVMGITGSYASANRLVEEIGKHHQDRVVDKIKDGFPIRIIGDNLNVKLGVRHERGDYHGTMYNWFSSAVIVQSNPFTGLPQNPQGLAKDLPLDSFLPNSSDFSLIHKDYTAHICGIAKEFCPHLEFLFPNSNQFTSGENRAQLHEKNITIPLQTLPLNEQKYSDVVQIMESYESTLKDIYSAAGKSVPSVQVGGDQLTRERFSGGKGLRTGCSIPEEKFAHLTPITFEMWHTGMNFLACIFKELFDEGSYEKGTMNSAKIKLSRKTVKADVKNHYDHDKDFFLSFVKSYVVEALCEYFGMQTYNDMPTKNIPPDDVDETWINNTISDFIEKFVFASSTDASATCQDDQDVTVTIPLNVTLPNGSIVTLHVTRKEKKRTTYTQHDDLKHYGHTVLQLGLLFMQFLHICSTPDRQRMMSTFKFMMKILKAKNQRSKYALEILRFLCHQQSTYSLQTAHMSFYGLFVNNYGRIDGNIAADLQMEHLIRKIKTLFKNCGPNNIESSIIKKSKAIGGLMQISSNFDNSTSVITRSQKHKNKNAYDDEVKVIQELRQEQPFKCKLGRSLRKFDNIRAPAEACLDNNYYIAWIKHYQNVFTCDPSQ